MLDLSPDKLFMLAIVALVVLGPNRLPSAARTVGRFVGQLRSMSSSLQSEMRDALSEPEEAFTSALGDFRPGDVRRSVRRALTETIAPFESGFAPRTSNETARPTSPRPAVAADPFAGVIPVGSEELARPAAASDGRPNPDDPGLN